MSDKQRTLDLEEAKERLARLTVGLGVRFDPAEAAQLLMAAGVTGLVNAYGVERAAEFLRRTADSVEQEPPVAGPVN